MVGLTPSSFFVLTLVGMGGNPTDLASLLDPADYFQSRNIKVSGETMVELAGKDPADGKTQMQALLAIRWLGRHPDEARKAGAGAALQKLALAKRANDPHGFVSTYAARALLRIEGKPLPGLPAIPKDSLRNDALNWFPADTQLAAAADLRASGEMMPKHAEELLAHVHSLMPPQEKKAVYDFVDQVGNLRLDRVAFGLRFDPARPAEPEQIYVRFTGAGDHQRLAAVLKDHFTRKEERKGPRGESLTILSNPNSPPVVAILGDTDVVVAGYQNNEAKHGEVLDRLLDVRAGKKDGMVKGPLADLIKKVPDQACGMFIADLPEDFRKNALPELTPCPPRLLAYATRTRTINLHGIAVMKDAKDAEQLVRQLTGLREMALKSLENLPPAIKSIPGAVDVLRKPLTGARVEAKGETVEASTQIMEELIDLGVKIVKQEVRPR